MKLKITIDRNREEEILVFAHERTKLIDDLECLVYDYEKEIIGCNDGEMQKLSLLQTSCFVVENNKVYAITDEDKLYVKMRLYQLENMLGDNFVKINQSCIANVNKIKKFDTSITGTLKVIFGNGYVDYVSRRNVKTVKERLGVK